MSNEDNKIDRQLDQQLDQALQRLSRDVQPTRDLWPEIQASIELAEGNRRKPAFGLVQLAAGVVLVILSSVTTYLLTRDPLQNSANPAPAITAADDAVATEYLRSRAELDRLFAQRIATLPATTRAKLESNLADLRRAESEILAGLALHPSDSLLHELLMSTYQSEAQLLADLSEIPADLQRPRT